MKAGAIRCIIAFGWLLLAVPDPRGPRAGGPSDHVRRGRSSSTQERRPRRSRRNGRYVAFVSSSTTWARRPTARRTSTATTSGPTPSELRSRRRSARATALRRSISADGLALAFQSEANEPGRGQLVERHRRVLHTARGSRSPGLRVRHVPGLQRRRRSPRTAPPNTRRSRRTAAGRVPVLRVPT